MCDKNFAALDALTFHKKSTHDEVRYNNLCDKSFTSKRYLVHHQKSIHLKEKEVHSCNTCNKLFSCRASLNLQERHIHRGIKNDYHD